MPKSSAAPTFPPTSPAARAGYAKSLDTRARILAATLEEASDSGLHKASVARIAARAGVAVGILHYHFGSRGGLLRELMGSLMADLLPRLHAADADEHTDFFERERAGLLVYLAYLRANPAHVRLAGEIRLHEPELYRRAVRDWVRRIATRIRQGIARGAVRPMDETEITAQAWFILGVGQLLDQLLEHSNDHSHPRDEAVVDAYVALLRHGIACDSGIGDRSKGRSAAAARSASPKTNRRKARPTRPSRSKGRKGR